MASGKFITCLVYFDFCSDTTNSFNSLVRPGALLACDQKIRIAMR